jgi:hypothetical protein
LPYLFLLSAPLAVLPVLLIQLVLVLMMVMVTLPLPVLSRLRWALIYLCPDLAGLWPDKRFLLINRGL